MKKFFAFIFAKPKKDNGYTLLELVVYVGVLSIAVLAIFMILFSITRAFTEARIYNEVEISGTTAMERMVREIRTASSVDEGNSVLDANPGQLQLNTTDEAGIPKTIQFYFDAVNKTINLDDNGTDKGSLTGNGVEITNLVFRKWTTAKSALIKIEMTIQSKRKTTLNAKFYDSVVMRGGY
jgi:type II secretory pathway pseudopilin PulG